MKHGLYAMMIDSILYMINIDNQNYDNIVIWLLIILLLLRMRLKIKTDFMNNVIVECFMIKPIIIWLT